MLGQALFPETLLETTVLTVLRYKAIPQLNYKIWNHSTVVVNTDLDSHTSYHAHASHVCELVCFLLANISLSLGPAANLLLHYYNCKTYNSHKVSR